MGKKVKFLMSFKFSNLKMKSPQMLSLWWLAVLLLLRIIPHAPNFIPFLALTIFTSRIFSRRIAIVVVLTALFLSDIVLSFMKHYPIFSCWSLFTYSGIFIVVCLSSIRFSFKSELLSLLILAAGSVLWYWIWTNFGVWLMSDMYPHNLQGFVFCYVAAIPFLGSSMLADLTGVLLLFFSIRVAKTFGLFNWWWPEVESNHRHEDFQSSALPTELSGQKHN